MRLSHWEQCKLDAEMGEELDRHPTPYYGAGFCQVCWEYKPLDSYGNVCFHGVGGETCLGSNKPSAEQRTNKP